MLCAELRQCALQSICQTVSAGVSRLIGLGAGETQSCKLLVCGTHHERSTLGMRTAPNLILLHGHIACCESLTGWMWKSNVTIICKFPKIVIPCSHGDYVILFFSIMMVILQNWKAKDRLYFSA